MTKCIESLRICVVGAGVGGLTCALALARRGFENIKVFEAASNLGFVGAGIQLAPNMARILDLLGVWTEIAKEAVDLQSTSIRDAENDTELGHVDLQYIAKTYKYPHMVGHRESLVRALFRGCQAEPAISLCFATKVVSIEALEGNPSVIFQRKDDLKTHAVDADVVLAADGIKSGSREQILKMNGINAEVRDTGQAAYRIMLAREQLQDDTELLELIETNRVTRWIGEKRHVIAYPISNKKIYNISTIQPDDKFAAAPSATYTTRGSKNAMLDVFSDFCPRVRRLLDLVPENEVCEWKLRVHAPLPTWVYGRVALLGDACHPTLPHLAQGAAQAIEDAAVVAVVLAHLKDTSQSSINKALLSYESIRKNRAEELVELAFVSGRGLHLGKGEARDERDRVFAASRTGGGPVPDKWADADVQRMIYGFDCVQAAEAFLKATDETI